MHQARSTTLTGWGRTAPSRADVFDVDDASLAEAVASAGSRGALVRGLGRSYGDAAQNAGGTVVRLVRPAGGVRLDASTALVTAHAGATFDDLLRHLVPKGFFVPVTPGSRFVSLGGAIAADVHGKNHHVDGSFGNHLRSISMLMADGVVRELTAESDPELWWATIGGMGLTGIVVEATFAVLPIETSRCVVDTTKAGDLDALLAAMADGDERYQYSVAWVDLLARGKHLGRSVLTRGDHATVSQVKGRRDPTGYRPLLLAGVPPGVPNLLNHASVRAFNEMWFRKSPRRRQGEIQSITRFFHPLDGIAAWNRLYGRRGFLQYQFVVPFGEEAALRGVVERVVRSGHASFLAVLKRFGPGNPGPLSFPMAGWTLTLDLPAGAAGLRELVHDLDVRVLDAGGRHYLAKDSHTTPESIRRGYPRLAEWQEARHKADPGGLWISDIARRLELIG